MHPPSNRDPDRLLPADPGTRSIAHDLYTRVASRPIVSPHGHVPAALLADDAPFGDPAELFITSDHYVTRLLHASGVPTAELGLGGARPDGREIWRRMAEHWHAFAGTATGYWLEEELGTVLGIAEELGPDTSDQVYDAVAQRLRQPEFRPLALFRRFGVDVLATTDDPLDDLEAHERLAKADIGGRVIPTFRPDRYVEPASPSFRSDVERLVGAAGAPATMAGYLSSLAERRSYFINHGAVSADHGVEEPVAIDLQSDDAEHLFRVVLRGEATEEQQRVFRGYMLLQMAQMSVEDGLVMTVHAGVLRNHHASTYERYGSDTGHDIPVPTSFVRGLRPLLERFGLRRDFHLVLFTVDETTFSRELAPLAGFYPSVYVGAPWWFLDAPDAIGRFRSAVTETAGFSRTSGFIDDARALLSIPVRHDTARRTDAAYLARLVREGRLSMARAERIADDLVNEIPRRVFKLPSLTATSNGTRPRLRDHIRSPSPSMTPHPDNRRL